MKKLGAIIAVLFLLGCSNGAVEKPEKSKPSANQELMNSAFNTSQLSLTIKDPNEKID